MAIDLKEVKRFTADPKKIAVLVQNNRVTKTLAQLHLHNTQCKGFGINMLNGFHRGKSVMPQHAIRYTSKPSKLECFPAAYTSMNKTRKGTLIGKLYTSLGDLLFVGLARAQPGQALHMRLM
jgi:hypothetical protein